MQMVEKVKPKLGWVIVVESTDVTHCVSKTFILLLRESTVADLRLRVSLMDISKISTAPQEKKQNKTTTKKPFTKEIGSDTKQLYPFK
jgi:hypothetical protein